MASIDKTLTDIFSSIEPYLETSVIIAFCSVAVILLGIVLFANWLKNQYLSKKKKEVLQEQESQGKASSTSDSNSVQTIINNYLQKFINYIGFLSNKGMATTFYKANNFLKINIGGRNYAYRLPRYLLLGAANSGKSNLLETLNIRRMGKITETTEESKNPLKWFFYDTGSFLEVPGEFLIKEEAIDSNQSKFRELLDLLVHFRVQKPIDGFILTIPADELTTLQKLDIESLKRRAQYVKDQLTTLQNKLGFVLPVYVVITKCDLIDGFQEFLNVLPNDKLKDMFGWSSSFSLGENFSLEWLDYAFDYIMSQSLNNQFEVFLKNTSKEDAEKILLLPKNIDKLRSSIKTYLNILFKKDNYQEMFFFRGIYLTAQKTDNTAVSKKDSKNVRVISFIQDLIFDKIFPEYSIAMPAQRLIFSISKSINIARFVLLFIFITWSTGLWIAKENITQRSTNIQTNFTMAYKLIEKQPDISKVVYMIDGLPSINQQDLVLSIESLKRAYTILSAISKKTFSSVFIPSSWVNSLDSNLVKTSGIVMNRVIFQPIYYSFLYKLRILIVNAPKNLSNYNNDSSLFIPLATPEFLLLRGYIESAYYYQKAIDAFYGLNTTLDIGNINDITLFLFNISAPSEFSSNKPFYRKVIKYAHPKIEVTLSDFTTVAKERARLLFNSFTNFILKKNPGLELLDKTAKDLSLKGKSFSSSTSAKNLLNSMVFLFRNVSLDTFSWINKSSFEPGTDYDSVLHILNTLELFGSSEIMGKNLASNASSMMPDLQDTLAGYWSNTTGPILQISNNHVISEVSSGFISMLKNLHLFLNQPFMREPIASEKSLITILPAGKYMIWNAGDIDSIPSVIDSYQNFENSYLKKYPNSFQTYIKLLAQKYLNKHILSTITQAQILLDAPSSLTSYALEDSIRTQVANINKVIPTFEKVLKTLEDQNMSTTYLKIRNLIVSQAYSLLETVDTFFNTENFYEPLNGNYSWWDGSENIDFTAYNVDSNSALQTYLKTQQERISYLASTYAKPLVEFLSQPYLHLDVTKINLISKWNLIINQVQSYKAKKASNSISALEKYLQEDINTITLSTCSTKLSSSINSKTPTTNWFSQKELNLKKELYAECQKLTDKQSIEAYKDLSSFFNNNLSGKYPFVGGNLSSKSEDVSPESIKSFFYLYDQYNKTIQSYLDKNKNKANFKKAIDFMTSIKKVKEFFSSFLNSTKANALPNYELDITFRSNQRFESNANQILTWSFLCGTGSTTNHDKNPSINWRYSEPISIKLQWANGASFSPTTDPNQENLSTEGNIATLSVGGPWSLLKMIELYTAPKEYKEQNNSLTESLMFTVPIQSNYINGTTQTLSSRLFIDIEVKEVESNKSTKTLFVPYFPSSAPNI